MTENVSGNNTSDSGDDFGLSDVNEFNNGNLVDVFSGLSRNSEKTVNVWNLNSYNIDVCFFKQFFTIPFSALFENHQSVKQLFFWVSCFD